MNNSGLGGQGLGKCTRGKELIDIINKNSLHTTHIIRGIFCNEYFNKNGFKNIIGQTQTNFSAHYFPLLSCSRESEFAKPVLRKRNTLRPLIGWELSCDLATGLSLVKSYHVTWQGSSWVKEKHFEPGWVKQGQCQEKWHRIGKHANYFYRPLIMSQDSPGMTFTTYVTFVSSCLNINNQRGCFHPGPSNSKKYNRKVLKI